MSVECSLTELTTFLNVTLKRKCEGKILLPIRLHQPNEHRKYVDYMFLCTNIAVTLCQISYQFKINECYFTFLVTACLS